jgi:hypothetical protein
MDEPKITWRFTVKNGCVNHMSPQAPVKLQKDEDGKPFFRFPLPYPGTDKKIEEDIRSRYGTSVNGEGIYDEASDTVQFTPAMVN